MRAGAGNGIYANLLKESFNQSAACDVDFYWSHDEREAGAKFLRWLMGLSFPNEWVQRQNLDFRRSRSEIGNAYMARCLARRKISQGEYSVLHFHTDILAFMAIDLMKKLPTVLNLDMTSFQAYQEKTAPTFKWTYTPSFVRGKQCFEAAAKIVTWSDWAKKSVVENYSIDETKVKTVYPGIDLTKLKPIEKPIRDPQRRFRILFVGADFERKRGKDVLQVFLDRFSETAELNLVTKTAIECDCPHVYIHNDVKPYTSKWLELYQQSDVFVMPTGADSFGYVFIEAMAMGLPVIATKINAIPEIVTHGETGFLVQPGDLDRLALSIQTLLENPLLCCEMGSNAHQVVERKFNMQQHRQSLEAVFQEVSAPQSNKMMIVS